MDVNILTLSFRLLYTQYYVIINIISIYFAAQIVPSLATESYWVGFKSAISSCTHPGVFGGHLLTFWHHQAHLVLFLAQPRNLPLLQGAMFLLLKSSIRN